MRKFNNFSLVLFVLLAFTLTGCDLVVDIFEAGFWTAIVILLVVVGIIILLIRKFMS